MIPIADTLLRVAIAPVLIAQALFVRKTVQKLPEPPGPRDGVAGTGPALSLLILGDSSAAGVGVDTQDTALSGQVTARLAQEFRVNWCLIAKTGFTTADALRRLQSETGQDFDVAIIALGVNDVTRLVPLAVWCKQLDQLATLLKSQFGVTHICFSGVPPMGGFPALPNPLRWVLGRQSARLDQGLRRFVASRSDCSYVSLELPLDQAAMATDGFHPGAPVYAAWAERLKDAIVQNFSKTP